MMGLTRHDVLHPARIGTAHTGRAGQIVDGYSLAVSDQRRSRMIASVIACPFVSNVSMAAIALAATLPTPFSESHLVTSSIAAHMACWLCKSKVSASAVAILFSELSGTAIVLE
jgi:hypothetical protein